MLSAVMVVVMVVCEIEFKDPQTPGIVCWRGDSTWATEEKASFHKSIKIAKIR